MNTSLYNCPVCGQALTEEARGATCPSRHTFDRASEGYINLLLPQRGGTHGDNRAMVQARRRFLDRGYYDALADRVCAHVLTHLPKGGVLLDMGAGECFYTDRMERAQRAAGRGATLYAFDISKDAVRYAAKRNRALRLFVAGAYHLPVRTEAVDVAVNMFAPLATEETHRVLKDGGVFVLVIPEREHLFGLKAVLYDTPYKNTVEDAALPGFTLLSDEEVRYGVTVDGREAISDLLHMTPYGYRSPAAGVERLLSLPSVETDVHFRIFVYKKTT